MHQLVVERAHQKEVVEIGAARHIRSWEQVTLADVARRFGPPTVAAPFRRDCRCSEPATSDPTAYRTSITE
jgi:hypothetical protein